MIAYSVEPALETVGWTSPVAPVSTACAWGVQCTSAEHWCSWVGGRRRWDTESSAVACASHEADLAGDVHGPATSSVYFSVSVERPQQLSSRRLTDDSRRLCAAHNRKTTSAYYFSL